MQHTFWHGKSLLRGEFNRSTFHIDKQPSVNHIKALILLLMFVPMKFARNHADAYDTVVYRTQGLIKPLLRALLLYFPNIKYFQGFEPNVRGN